MNFHKTDRLPSLSSSPILSPFLNYVYPLPSYIFYFLVPCPSHKDLTCTAHDLGVLIEAFLFNNRVPIEAFLFNLGMLIEAVLFNIGMLIEAFLFNIGMLIGAFLFNIGILIEIILNPQVLIEVLLFNYDNTGVKYEKI